MAIATLTISTGAQQDIVTVPAGKRYAITNIMVCNTYDPNGSSPEAETGLFDMHFLPSGEALSTTLNCVVRQLSLPAGETFTFDSERIVLDEGDKLSFVGDTNGNLATTVSYLEV
jgi:hypothetical protein|tara:strand:- start:1287 stop:1631 length:345 start_codon:yes stop_codon:yes gene_type:complete